MDSNGDSLQCLTQNDAIQNRAGESAGRMIFFNP